MLPLAAKHYIETEKRRLVIHVADHLIIDVRRGNIAGFSSVTASSTWFAKWFASDSSQQIPADTVVFYGLYRTLCAKDARSDGSRRISDGYPV